MDNFLQDWEQLSFLSDDYNKGEIVYINDSQPYFNKITNQYPIRFYRINWDVLSHESFHVCKKYPENLKEIEDYVQAIFAKHAIPQFETVYVLFDGYMQGALKMNVQLFLKHCSELLTFPQHTYVIPINVEWCLNYTMEHDLYYGKLDCTRP